MPFAINSLEDKKLTQRSRTSKRCIFDSDEHNLCFDKDPVEMREPTNSGHGRYPVKKWPGLS